MRSLWRIELGAIDAERLVFVDEMGTHTSLAPLYAYAPIGERAFFEAPRNRGTNTTLLASLHSEGAGPSMAVEGATNKEVFEAYLEHFLVPALRPGQLVVMDNLGAHKGGRLKEVIEARGALPCFSCLCLLTGLLAHRGSLLQDKGAAKESGGSHARGPRRSDWPSTRSGHL